jgi:hypothetical protein
MQAGNEYAMFRYGDSIANCAEVKNSKKSGYQTSQIQLQGRKAKSEKWSTEFRCTRKKSVTRFNSVVTIEKIDGKLNSGRVQFPRGFCISEIRSGTFNEWFCYGIS